MLKRIHFTQKNLPFHNAVYLSLSDHNNNYICIYIIENVIQKMEKHDHVLSSYYIIGTEHILT